MKLGKILRALGFELIGATMQAALPALAQNKSRPLRAHRSLRWPEQE